MYVLKFRGAGQGPKALVAELVAGEIGRTLGLPIPEIVFAELDPDLARTEPDPEIHALIHDSGGLNLAIDYLPGSVMFDALMSNVDRTVRNPNILMWHRRLWLIDHGASLYFHHSSRWEEDLSRAKQPFPMLKEHLLVRRATMLDAVDDELSAALTPQAVDAAIDMIPDSWLRGDDATAEPEVYRAAYRRYL